MDLSWAMSGAVEQSLGRIWRKAQRILGSSEEEARRRLGKKVYWDSSRPHSSWTWSVETWEQGGSLRLSTKKLRSIFVITVHESFRGAQSIFVAYKQNRDCGENRRK